MSEIAKFVNQRLSRPSLRPWLKKSCIICRNGNWNSPRSTRPKFPHLVDQLGFLADAVEDAIEGAYKDLPYVAVAQSLFALLYAHKKMGIIPEELLELGRADDSSVVRAVLIQNEKAFAIYAGSQGRTGERSQASPDRRPETPHYRPCNHPFFFHANPPGDDDYQPRPHRPWLRPWPASWPPWGQLAGKPDVPFGG